MCVCVCVLCIHSTPVIASDLEVVGSQVYYWENVCTVILETWNVCALSFHPSLVLPALCDLWGHLGN